jgi:cytidine deaminase
VISYKSLLKQARTAQQHSFSPFSKFRVGAALLTKGGRVYKGCNVENSSYGLTMCAERTALFKAISEGERKFTAMALATDEKGFTTPCGACRQVMMDLAGNIDVIMSDGSGEIKIVKMLDLLPHPFGAMNLRRKKRKRS